MLMKRLFVLLMTLVAAPALAQGFASPVGTWEIEMRDSRYEVAMCGESGDQLCGTLIWLGGHADNDENRPYLNTLLIDHAPPAGENTWKGTLRIFGQTATGTITQLSDNQIQLEGCVAFIFCRTYQLYRIN
jgi:uncharacterized protein (DUF2147 family)